MSFLSISETFQKHMQSTKGSKFWLRTVLSVGMRYHTVGSQHFTLLYAKNESESSIASFPSAI